MINIHGYCPHCNTNLDGDLVIESFLNSGYDLTRAKTYAGMYVGWDEHGENNRWSRAIGMYSMSSDRTTSYRCPDCHRTWERD